MLHRRRPTQYKCYSEQDMQMAIGAVVSKKLSVRRASDIFRIPESTLESKLPFVPNPNGSTPFLTKEEEASLAKFITEQYRNGQPLTRLEILAEAKKLIEATGRPNPFRNNCPGYRWLGRFLRRNPHVQDKFLKRKSY